MATNADTPLVDSKATKNVCCIAQKDIQKLFSEKVHLALTIQNLQVGRQLKSDWYISRARYLHDDKVVQCIHI